MAVKEKEGRGTTPHITKVLKKGNLECYEL